MAVSRGRRGPLSGHADCVSAGADFDWGIHMRMRTAFGATVVALAIVSAASRDQLVVASGQHDREHQTAGNAAAPPQAGAMMKMHQEMMAQMKADEAKLDALVTDMNAARGDARMAAMTAVLNELVRQHKGMSAHMNEMHQMMDGRTMMRGR